MRKCRKEKREVETSEGKREKKGGGIGKEREGIKEGTAGRAGKSKRPE
jgi:hypothetical protein